MLKLYIAGKLDKRTLKERQNYLYVLDMNRLKHDVRLNSISEYSFVCVDKTFFNEGYNLSDGGTTQKSTLPIVQKKQSKAVEEDELGFCFGDDSSDEEPKKEDSPKKQELEEEEKDGPIPELKMNLDNKFIQEDLALMNSLCSDIVS